MSIFFCRQTGVRIIKPGVSESVDPVAGVPEWTGDEPEPGDASDKKPKQGGQPKGKANEQRGNKPASVPPPAPVVESTDPAAPVSTDASAPPFGSVQS